MNLDDVSLMGRIMKTVSQITVKKDKAIQCLYKVDMNEKLRAGDYAQVCKARDLTNGRDVALKVGINNSDPVRKHFEREQSFLGRYHHPHIVVLHGAHDVDRIPVLDLEYFPSTLDTLIRFKHDKNKDIDVRELAGFLEPVCRAAEFTHSNASDNRKPWVHRDIRPANVLVGPRSEHDAHYFTPEDFHEVRPENCTIKIGDFGLARIAGTGSTRGGAVAYRAPETFTEQEDAFSPASDWYSIAVLAYSIIMGKTPFDDFGLEKSKQLKEDEAELRKMLGGHGLHPKLTEFFVHGMHPNPARRYKSKEEFISELLSADTTIDGAQREAGRQREFYRSCDELESLLESARTSQYGTLCLETINRIYEVYTHLVDDAEKFNFQNDGRFVSAMKRLAEVRRQGEKIGLEAEMRRIQGYMKHVGPGELVRTPESAPLEFEWGKYIHLWGPKWKVLKEIAGDDIKFANEQFTLKDIKDGVVYQNHFDVNFDENDHGVQTRRPKE